MLRFKSINCLRPTNYYFFCVIIICYYRNECDDSVMVYSEGFINGICIYIFFLLLTNLHWVRYTHSANVYRNVDTLRRPQRRERRFWLVTRYPMQNPSSVYNDARECIATSFLRYSAKWPTLMSYLRIHIAHNT